MVLDEIIWLKQTFASFYGIPVNSAHKVRDAWKVETADGFKCFKQVETSFEQALFIAAVVQHLMANGFTQTARFLITLQNTPVLKLPEGVFYATDWLSGREGDFSNFQDIGAAAKALARLHKASRNFVAPKNCLSKESWGTIPTAWQKHSLQLREFRAKALQEPADPFNSLFLEYLEKYLERVIRAQNLLQSCNYWELVDTAKSTGNICHRDYTYHNFLINDENVVSIIDFDYCTQDIRAFDVGRFMRKVAKYHHYALNPVEYLLTAYQTVEILTVSELRFILAYLHFPQRFWRIACRYYLAKAEQPHSHLLRQLQTEIADLNLEQRFLEKFSELIP